MEYVTDGFNYCIRGSIQSGRVFSTLDIRKSLTIELQLHLASGIWFFVVICSLVFPYAEEQIGKSITSNSTAKTSGSLRKTFSVDEFL